ncbi:hypothetical protein BN7_4660 [Wickerhamomyces ciferrii]|uniref:Uncharacterized protein n=1 Tax=Wickerhamomyces ciferrii (strain ATCC 14091 / BCRC 22168 / CBS 111 / JCM 3599 / NBRC 0793 / NRRL Y-1031 F-60-10) TaxID=1206466 RepID=K0KSQ8_WICCF|nr:uncharacterized protein BN7_4660 [Wickerhamomyces ciferrii]CCH45082.1 hypothetical protein BN7_4660 [Wickerhamomyces ciferrii]
MIISDEIITWERSKEIIETNALAELYRNFSETARYGEFKLKVKANGSTVVNEIIRERLQWVNKDGSFALTPKSNELFTYEKDVKIITNDFPYNFEDSITHFVVWSKVIIESDPNSDIGDVDDLTKEIINTYVYKSFVEALGLSKDQVIWFRNFPAIQSVKELSHIHVLIKDLDTKHFSKIIGTPGVVLSKDEIASLKKSF